MRHLFVSFAVAGMLAGCGNPLDNVPRLSDVSARQGGISVAETPNDEFRSGGLFGRLNRDEGDRTNAAIDAALRDVNAAPERDEPAEILPAALSRSTRADAERPRRGLGGIFRRNSGDEDAPRTGPDATDVEAGTSMAFGQIARVCDVPESALGRLADGGAGYRIYDTAPGSTTPRPFYITGFSDKCARTFSGAVVIAGDVETHEFVRYQSSNEGIAYTSTDNAYEAIKANECRVGRGQPCGDRTAQLNQNTYFITVYSFFGGTFSAVPTEWAQILLHDGEVLAMSIKNG